MYLKSMCLTVRVVVMNLLRVICLSLAFALSPPVIMMAPLVLVAPVRASPVALPLASTAMPESRFKFSCGRTFGTCGVHYCEDSYEDPYAQPFYGMSSTDSLYQNYNLASLLRSKEASELKGFCIDKSLLANPDASYDINQLHGEGFWGWSKWCWCQREKFCICRSKQTGYSWTKRITVRMSRR